MRTRPSLLLAASLAAGGLIAAPACAVDSGPGTPVADAGGQPDSGPPPDAAPPPIDGTPACDEIQQNVLETGHHPTVGGIPWVYYDSNGVGGTQGCLGGGCHNGVNGEKYTIGGALFDRRTGDGQGGWAGNPIAGAYIYAIDGTGKVIKMMTAQNGYFWSSEPYQIPLRVYASGCPDSVPMVANTAGNCALSTCHGREAKIYLPNYAASNP